MTDSLGDRMKRYESVPREDVCNYFVWRQNDALGWLADHETPIFKQDRAYVEKFVFPVDKLESRA